MALDLKKGSLKIWGKSGECSTPPLVEGHKRSVCFCLYNKSGQMEWFIFGDVSNKDEPHLLPRFPVHEHHHYTEEDTNLKIMGEKKKGLVACMEVRLGGSWAVVGSTIYYLGGGKKIDMMSYTHYRENPRLTKDVYVFNIRGGEGEGWIKGPSMIAPRASSDTLILDGKLYVLAGADDSAVKHPWGEVFDPIKNEWEALPDPPSWLICSGLITAALPAEKKIIVGSREKNLLYSYNVVTKHWLKLYGHDLCAFPLSGQPVAVGPTLFWLALTGQLCAYNLDKKEWSAAAIVDHRWRQEDLRDYGFPPALSHLGGHLFCLLWAGGVAHPDFDEYDSDSSNLSRIHCLKFELFEYESVKLGKIETRRNSLMTSIESCQSCVIEGRGMSFCGGILLG